MNKSKTIASLLAASMLAAIPVVLAQGAPPPPPPPPPAPAANAGAPGASGAASGRRGGRGAMGAGTGAFQAPDQPTAEEFATLNKALKDLISKADPDAGKALAAHPTWMPLQPARGGAPGVVPGGNTGRRGGSGGTGGRRGGSGAPAGSGAAPAGSGA